jgi:hypothetical protein
VLPQWLPVLSLTQATPAAQRLKQLPQVSGRVRSVSQPSLGLEVQCTNPITQSEG